MARFFLPPDEWTASPRLAGDEARHFSQVLRGRAGDAITVFDGKGRRAQAEVLSVSRDYVPLRLGDVSFQPPQTPAVTLAQAIPKGKNMDLIVQKAVELGVTSIQPLVTRYTVVQPGEGKAEKWRRIVLEACKQCGRDHLPEVFEPVPISDWLVRKIEGLKIIASLADKTIPLKDILRANSPPKDITILVGPEGDFSENETELALKEGFMPVTLGDIVLRVETASLLCLSSVRYEFC